MVVVIDDRAEVWNWADNLIVTTPYEYFVGAGDINAPATAVDAATDPNQNGGDPTASPANAPVFVVKNGRVVPKANDTDDELVHIEHVPKLCFFSIPIKTFFYQLKKKDAQDSPGVLLLGT